MASPGDVGVEREAVGSVAAELNQTQGADLDYILEVVRWETHAAPGGGRPQQVINDLLGQYEIFVGIMWCRFGTPTSVAGSGTEEEFKLAYAAWEQDNTRPLMFYFCKKAFMPPRDLEEIEQIRQVALFRKNLEGKALIWDYDGPEAFKDQLRPHLYQRMKALIQKRRKPGRSGAQPNDDTVRALKELWQHMDPPLQRSFNIAYNENRRAGDAGIKTADLFSAMLRVRPSDLEPIVQEIPELALPKPTAGAVVEEPYILQERPWLSGCVAASLRRMKDKMPAGHMLNAADIFADIAKHGSGESVRLLRKHNVGPAEIDQILRQKNMRVVGE